MHPSSRAFLSLVAGATALFAAHAASAAETIKIGVAGPFSGAYAAFGEQQWRGAEQAAKDINAAGGVMGKMIELAKGDDACEPKQAVAVANRLVDNDGIVAVAGHFCSSSTMPSSEVYADAGVLQMTHGSTNPQVTDRGIPTIFRMCGRDDQQGVVGAEFVINTLKAKNIAVLHDKTVYGKGLADAMMAHMKSLGLQPVLYEGLTQGEKDFNALVTKVKAAKSDAVYFGGLHAEAGPLVRQMREQGIDAPFVSGDGIVSEEFVLAAGGPQYVKNVFMTFGADPRRIAAGKALVEKFRAAGYEPEGYTLYSYAVIQSITQAIAGTKTTDADKLAKWLKTHGAQTVMGPKSWDAKGDLKVSDYVMYKWNDDGKYEQMD
ncbi:branched-chain amino acid ABC transporter substrate-binding protein [Magnetofaba australis]|uniref:Putative extracellular ligand-binding receptor n=1 Tax=Magnetofaba australis IT-1 TaxID=1434232 RepID=A0A1Y2K154_9PROT|nr:branched-chain amino acid ABC transporter substrate-binding protein [Magnetofaba australis]OSM01773.1 putative extracellular ligand-binding receptor [Magnetofaba australis IT-1]